MKFIVKVSGEAALGLPEQDFEVDSPSGGEAVDAVRDHLAKLAPREGGLLEVEVRSTEAWEQVSQTQQGRTVRETIPPGIVSSFAFRVEPHESVREVVEAKRVADEIAAAKTAEREALKAELRLELEAEQKAGGKVAVSK